jgi:hypothetical protein
MKMLCVLESLSVAGLQIFERKNFSEFVFSFRYVTTARSGNENGVGFAHVPAPPHQE